MSGWVLGVIGGSGLYEIEGLKDPRWVKLESSFGEPSGEALTGSLGPVTLFFLPRHDRGHRLPPSDINARANIDGLKRAGCTDILSLSAVGSLREALEPGTFVVVDQYIDRTFAREKSFFGPGLAAHVSMAEPVCARLSGLAGQAARAAGAQVVDGGTYLAMEGPQFSTKAESALYRSWGCDVIGMTNMPEAKLAREAELPYASVAMVTDYDCWREDEAHVEVTHIQAILAANADKARALVKLLAAALPATREPSPIDTALDGALITAPAGPRPCDGEAAVGRRRPRPEGLRMNLAAIIRTIPDYPKPGIMFRDITTLLGDARAFRRAVDELVQPFAGMKVDKVAGIEARGFILGGAVAHQLSAGSCRCGRRASCRTRPGRWSTRWNTATTPWRCTSTR